MHLIATLRGRAYFVREGKRKSGKPACETKPQRQAILLELPQKTHVTLKQHPQVRNVVFEARHALNTNTERKA